MDGKGGFVHAMCPAMKANAQNPLQSHKDISKAKHKSWSWKTSHVTPLWYIQINILRQWLGVWTLIEQQSSKAMGEETEILVAAYLRWREEAEQGAPHELRRPGLLFFFSSK